MKTKYLFLSLTITFCASFFFFVPFHQKSDKTYIPRENLYEKQGIKGAIEWLNSIRNNQITNSVDLKDIIKVREQIANLRKQKNTSEINLDWIEMGPDNVGGRTRAILIDKTNPTIMYAGGVAGGLWKSINSGQSWAKVVTNENNGLFENLAVVSICQAANGDIYFGTGEGHYSGNGDGSRGINGQGIWKSSDNGNTFSRLSSTWTDATADKSAFVYVNKLAADPTNKDKIYAATAEGIRMTNDGGLTWTNPVTNANGFSGDVKIASDGAVIASIGTFCYTSTDGTTWVKNSTLSGARLEFAFAPSDPNYVYCQAANNDGSLKGIYQSKNKGVGNWTVIGQGGSPFFNTLGEQGTYDNTIAVFPSNKEKVIVGGQYALWLREDSLSGWETISWWNIGELSSKYIHADQHCIVFHPTNPNTFYVGSDGGISRSIDGGNNFTTLNKSYNITQFYSVAYSPNGQVMGGTQDNGTQYISLQGNTTKTAFQVSGGDGGYSEISQLMPDRVFSTVYYGSLYRSEPTGMTPFYSSKINNKYANKIGEVGTAAFVTPIKLWESFNDTKSIDSVKYTNRYPLYLKEAELSQATAEFNQLVAIYGSEDVVQVDSIKDSKIYVTNKVTLHANDLIVVASKMQRPIYHVIQETLNPYESIMIQDKYQSVLAVGFKDNVWITRDAIDLTITDPAWYPLVAYTETPSTIGMVNTMAWSKDGDILYFADENNLYRSSNISNSRTRKTMNGDSTACTINTMKIGNWGQKITSIAVDPSNSNNVIVTLGNYGNANHVYYSNNAATTTIQTGNFVEKQGNLPQMPVYSSVINWKDSRQIIIGTEYGVWSTDNILASNVTWTSQSAGGLENVPVFMMRQQTNPNGWYEETFANSGIENHGYLYIATHGRGIFRTESLRGPTGIEKPEINNTLTSLASISLYPNPATEFTNVSYNLAKTSTVEFKIYDLQGKLIKSEIIKQSAGKHIQEMNISTLKAGTYIMSVVADGKKSASKFIVN